MLSEEAKARLKKIAGVDECEFEYHRKSKWVVDISLTNGGLGLFARFKFNVRKGTMDRMV